MSAPVPRPLRLAAFWGALLFACVMAVLPHPPALPGAPGDKVQHVAAFATLALLAALAYPQASLWRIGMRLALLGAAIEIVQAIPALHRDCSARDWLTDATAITIMLGLIALSRRSARGGDAPRR
ncbi:MAG: hypothetical protein ABW173_05230 [Sphingomonas sp.]